jgi:hypothetical protein
MFFHFCIISTLCSSPEILSSTCSCLLECLSNGFFLFDLRNFYFHGFYLGFLKILLNSPFTSTIVFFISFTSLFSFRCFFVSY